MAAPGAGVQTDQIKVADDLGPQSFDHRGEVVIVSDRKRLEPAAPVTRAFEFAARSVDGDLVDVVY